MMRRLVFSLAVLGLAAGASADTKQQRGSLLGIGIPGRVWLAEPDGTLANTDRMSLMYYSSWVAPANVGGSTIPPLLYHYEQIRRQGALGPCCGQNWSASC